MREEKKMRKKINELLVGDAFYHPASGYPMLSTFNWTCACAVFLDGEQKGHTQTFENYDAREVVVFDLDIPTKTDHLHKEEG